MKEIKHGYILTKSEMLDKVSDGTAIRIFETVDTREEFHRCTMYVYGNTMLCMSKDGVDVLEYIEENYKAYDQRYGDEKQGQKVVRQKRA